MIRAKKISRARVRPTLFAKGMDVPDPLLGNEEEVMIGAMEIHPLK